jgi:hypothetical protein
MAFSDLKFYDVDFTDQDVSSLPDQVFGQAAMVKARIDNIGKMMIALGKWNELMDALDALDTELARKAPMTNPHFYGEVLIPEPAYGDVSNKAASTATVYSATAGKANLASPSFTGTPTAPTAASTVNTTQIATTAFVTTAVSTKANLASPALTGTPTAPTAAATANSTQIATTAFVQAKAPKMAMFGITADIPIAANTYTQVILNKTVVNNISGCSLNTSTGNITLPAGTYIITGTVTFAGVASAVQVSAYVKNPNYSDTVKSRALIGVSGNADDKSVQVVTMFTITSSGTTYLGAKTTLALSAVPADYYTHIEIMKIG